MDSIRIHPADNVEVLLKPRGDVPAGHKLALRDIRAGEKIVKYGFLCHSGQIVHVPNIGVKVHIPVRFGILPEKPPDG